MKLTLTMVRLLFVALVLFSCKGEDGDPGPAGDKGAQGDKGDKGDQGLPGEDGSGGGIPKSGSITGTATGKQKDGTDFTYDFTYEYTFRKDAFLPQSDGSYMIVVERLEEPNEDAAGLSLVLTSSDKAGSDIDFIQSDFLFYKELPENKLLAYDGYLLEEDFNEIKVVYPINDEDNADYKLDLQAPDVRRSAGGLITFQLIHDFNTGDNYYPTTDGNKVYYDYDGPLGDDQVYVFDRLEDSDGNVLAEGVYADTYVVEHDEDEDGNKHSYKFFDASETDLSTSEVVEVDRAITEYTYDASSGSLKFHFTITYPGVVNSTFHDTQIEGDVDIKIYDEVVAREAAPN